MRLSARHSSTPIGGALELLHRHQNPVGLADEGSSRKPSIVGLELPEAEPGLMPCHSCLSAMSVRSVEDSLTSPLLAERAARYVLGTSSSPRGLAITTQSELGVDLSHFFDWPATDHVSRSAMGFRHGRGRNLSLTRLKWQSQALRHCSKFQQPLTLGQRCGVWRWCWLGLCF